MEQKLPPAEQRDLHYRVGQQLRQVLTETQFSTSPAFKAEVFTMLHNALSLWPALMQDNSLLRLQVLL